jgi:hypothetical protein
MKVASLSVDVRSLAIGFAIVANLILALLSFFMLPVIEQLHRLGAGNVETLRMTRAAWLSFYFALVPLGAVFLIRLMPATAPPPKLHDPFYDDLASTVQILAALAISSFAAMTAVLRALGLTGTAESMAVFQAIFYTMTAIYTILLSDPRDPEMRRYDLAVAIAILTVCVVFVHRENIFLTIPLLVRERSHTSVKNVVWVGLGSGAVMLLSSILRNSLDLGSTVVRVLGNQFKYIERFGLNFGIFDRCYGPATILGFVNQQQYDAFYSLIFDPVMLTATGFASRWDSSNLQERLNYAYCSVSGSFLIYFGFLVLLLYLEKRLRDLRYFRVAFLTIFYAYAGFNFYNLPEVTALCLLFASGFWRIGRGAFMDINSPAPVT